MAPASVRGTEGAGVAAAVGELGERPRARRYVEAGMMKRVAGYVVAGLVGVWGVVACSGRAETRATGGGPVVLRDEINDSSPMSLTVVHLHADGTQDVTMTTVTVGQEKAAKAKRLAHQAAHAAAAANAALAGTAAPAAPPPRFRPQDNTPVQDPYCDDETLWLYQGTNGTLAKACLYAPDTYGPNGSQYGIGPAAEVNLATTQYCASYNLTPEPPQCLTWAYWNGNIKSLWAGEAEEGASEGCISQNSAYNSPSGYQHNFAVGSALFDTGSKYVDTNYVWMNQTCCTTAGDTTCPGMPEYNSMCHDLQDDPDNCGMCGNVCGVGQSCSGGL